ncbi:PTS sugar transporter subunit IIA [Lacticaseibacillus parahuelsenbergensis]|uniref:Ascorbate-specific PTS system EIIA component n=1 Tax=Lacticaseibacillus parahuelsenbergensis TaxID=3068305 RepID=A0ABY9L4A8_9LACO|nr:MULTISPECIES: PTS sugar transporter subunit IIA [Lacticaseibacillus]MDE3281521.1 PTS sugar transporter subunit IIA [Lacticaseibacillus casei]WLV78437.1 PTS sugar transporter subunit IIA [Lacticaseibacillus sp. NCIMB 15471]
MIEKIITDSLIQLKVKATSWRDAIQKAGRVLVADGDVTQNYVDEIIRSAEKFGPYFVIAPHVALAHAPRQAGAKTLAMGITTLDPPIDFHNKANDPVRYVFTLSAPNANSHLKAMQEFVQLLSTDGFYNVLDQAVSGQEIMTYIESTLSTNRSDCNG